MARTLRCNNGESLTFLGPEARKLTEHGLEELLADLYDAGMHASDAREGSPRQSARCSRGTKR